MKTQPEEEMVNRYPILCNGGTNQQGRELHRWPQYKGELGEGSPTPGNAKVGLSTRMSGILPLFEQSRERWSLNPLYPATNTQC